MSSYFANYMPDMRNGGVVSAEHQHQHYGAAVQVPQGGGAVQTDPSSCSGDPSVVGLRQGIPPHHYGGPPAAGQPPQGMPYPRFPPYDRMDIRNAGYYNAQQQQIDGTQYRPDSPTSMHMGGNGAPNGHQTPVVYASCKLQAAAVTQNGVLGPTGSPPLDSSQNMTNHHMGHHMQEQHPQHHQQPHHQQQHMMYGAQQNANMHQAAPHQQAPPLQQQPQPGQQPPSNTGSALPSPLYPWMRSQFGELIFFL
ncbi:hypothetical protein NQ314_002376 [Rhamnusium bicolor]|uniref:Antennapedia n=1 Tax=Rhamnusium bicolor TaxID=1586634 RepID=A0AAV8ZRP0_9CUCU|nr:hypothetical protein NQ314_002376 [Rhamnusium bicolor]